MKQYKDPKFARSVACFRLAFLARQRLQHEIERGVSLYGKAGNQLSGGHYPHWPENAKRKIRRLNRMCNRLDDAGMKARPPRVLQSTMRNLRLHVTTETIRAQHRL